MRNSLLLPLLLALAICVAGCAKDRSMTSQPPTAPAAVPAATAPVEGPRVILADNFTVSVEIVIDDEARAQGLMYRDQLLPGTGMLFVFPADGNYPFWMKNTRIPLDMIWIDAGGKVVYVRHDVPPCRAEPCPSYPPGDTIGRYVLEVAGGVARAHNVKVGDQLKFEQMPPAVASAK